MSALIPWKPFAGIDKFFANDDWLFPVFSNKELSMPAMDLYETDKNVIAEINIPDFDPNKVEISIENGMLKIVGAMEDKREENKKGYWRKEIRKGSFERILHLPVAVKENDVEAVYDKGVLKITMPKASLKSATKKIKIAIKE